MSASDPTEELRSLLEAEGFESEQVPSQLLFAVADLVIGEDVLYVDSSFRAEGANDAASGQLVAVTPTRIVQASATDHPTRTEFVQPGDYPAESTVTVRPVAQVGKIVVGYHSTRPNVAYISRLNLDLGDNAPLTLPLSDQELRPSAPRLKSLYDALIERGHPVGAATP